ncbi:SGNH/GDSL hydrolase family protein [Demequina sp. NBRC 110056]|uniref:SGNH/GDSL hydrolase family protein n=1 Tax=Demequina sp. NBRC 110056 TaxID=1570345 RepID=UPI000A07486C|nr:SGNH/GDSL hydrolase family protein [Demequina sp. NBRC 110056]
MHRGPSVVAIGDSLTLGVGDGTQHPRGDVGWAAHTAHALGASAFVNLAANGTRARDLAATQVERANAADPGIILASAGGNDVLRGDFDPDEVERELTAVLRAVSRADRRVVVLGIDRIGLFDALPRAVTAVMARRVSAANAAIVTSAAAAGATLVDGGAVFRAAGARAWHIDRIHPSPLGHRRLAEAAVASLAPEWPQVTPIAAAPAPPRLHARAWWLMRNGAPWAVRRSRDLIPQVAQVVTHELLEDRRARMSGAARA